jgi:predicted SprT family Zn-dependent metalloprotease
MFDSLDDIEAFAREQMEHFGVSSFEFKWNNRITNTLGFCAVTKGIIELSTKFCILNLKTYPRVIRDVILHEIAHALEFDTYGTIGHGENWKKCCIITGATPEEFMAKKHKRLNHISLVNEFDEAIPKSIANLLLI